MVSRIRRVYVQHQEGLYVAPCGLAAHTGFRFHGIEVRPFEEFQLPMLPLTPETLVHGWVRTVHAALTQIGRPVPPAIDYPDELRSCLVAPAHTTTLEAVRESWRGEVPVPVFIKPVAHKLFTGHTIDRFSDLAETASLPGETPVWAAGVVDHQTEYRCFVLEHRLVGIKHYRGSPWILPDKATILQMIRDYAPSAPVAYGLDVGVVDGRTVLVEVNDAYSLGDYGLSPITYAEMLEARWLELMGD